MGKPAYIMKCDFCSFLNIIITNPRRMNMVNICSMHDETGEDTHTLLAGKLQGQTTLWRPTST